MLDILEWRQRRNDFGQAPVAVIAGDHIGNIISIAGLYEERELGCLVDVVFPILPSGVCLDIGANIGNHARVFANYFETVHCFEINSEVLPILTYNTRSFSNTTVHALAASDKAGTLCFKRAEGANAGASAVVRGASDEGTGLAVQAVAIDDEREALNIEKVSFIKLDVEGHELRALQGLRKTLALEGPVIAFECNDALAGGSLREFLESEGYTFFYKMCFSNRLARNKVGRNLLRLLNVIGLLSTSMNYTLEELSETNNLVAPLIVVSKTKIV